MENDKPCQTYIIDIFSDEFIHPPYWFDFMPSDEPKSLVRIWKRGWKKVENEPAIKVGNQIILTKDVKIKEVKDPSLITTFTGEVLDEKGVLLEEYEVDMNKPLKDILEEAGVFIVNGWITYTGKYMDKQAFEKAWHRPWDDNWLEKRKPLDYKLREKQKMREGEQSTTE